MFNLTDLVSSRKVDMDSIELWNGSTKALVSLDGAWLTNLSDDDGDILFPKRRLEAADGTKKDRGGCHVCLPNFGPGGDSELLQHGFGRTSLWTLDSQSIDTVTLTLDGGGVGYEQLSSTLTYTLESRSMRIELTVKNRGDHPLRVAPAFHPYFALRANEGRVMIDGEPIDIQDLEDTLFLQGEKKQLQLERRTIRLASKNLSTWAAWTDRIGEYVCLEPTYAGNSFLLPTPDSDELLEPQNVRTYIAEISW